MKRVVHRNLAKRKTSNSSQVSGSSPVFMDHIRELQWRLAIVALAFLATGAAVYPFFDKIVALLLKPLGNNLSLVYLTPGGAFNFAVQVCIYAAMIGALPVALYHIYRFVMPAVEKTTLRGVLGYSLSSLLLAAVGVAFSYFLALPAAIQFLTSFDLKNISPMLTVESYLSFVMTYLLAGALLFQLPLFMTIINRIKPMTPRMLMSGQRHVILWSVVFAAVISPTPDAVNQLLLAAPMIVMYQVGIVIILLKNRKRADKKSKDGLLTRSVADNESANHIAKEIKPCPMEAKKVSVCTEPETPILVKKPASNHTLASRRSLDGFVVMKTEKPSPVVNKKVVIPKKTVSKPVPIRRSLSRSVDGFSIPSRSVSVSVPSRSVKLV
jgi:Twin arginine targeting (Tat) protein translocase TatC